MAQTKASHEAEKRIEEARASGATILNLSKQWRSKDDNAPTELSELLGQLTQLQSLDLSGNRLTTLPKWLGNLTQLRTLDLSGNQLTVLPEWLSEFTQLQELNLSGNQVTVLPEWLSEFTQLQELNLSHSQLTALPEWLGKLAQLQKLGLSDNRLTALPEWLSKLTQLQELDLSRNHLTVLAEWFSEFTQLRELNLPGNYLTALPESLGNLTHLINLSLWNNKLKSLPNSIGNLVSLKRLLLPINELTSLPESIGRLKKLKTLDLGHSDAPGGNPLGQIPESLSNIRSITSLGVYDCGLNSLPIWLSDFTQIEFLDLGKNQLLFLPDWIAQLTNLRELRLTDNQLTSLPESLADLPKLRRLNLGNNPLNPELIAAYEQGLDAVKTYLRAKATEQVMLNEAKLILVGEGEVGKTCLMDALQGAPWQKHETTHGIEIRPVQVTDPETGREITLNGWDFGGQRVYRPTHQLFFSSPGVYLVVWKPREGPQQGFVKEWIKLIKHREPDAKILVVATHGGPQQRQPDIDRQELWDLFGKDTVIDFFHVESRPDKNGKRRGIEELKLAIAHIATNLPEMGRSVPKSFQEAREALKQTNAAYLPLEGVLDICREHEMDDEIARLFVTISHRLGHLIHYQHDPTLRDIVVLKPNWLAAAMSFVLDDQATRDAHGLVRFSHLSQLWDDPTRTAEFRYPANLHRIFLRLMERFDLSYRVAGLSPHDDTNPASLIAQLVPDTHPGEHLDKAWPSSLITGDVQQMQICRIVDARGRSATAEGLFYQLIVRLHRYSLGRINYHDSIHWQRGLVVDDDYNGRALLEYKGNDVHITVRAAYPVNFLAMLTNEVKYLVESFWEGLQGEVMVPCLNPKPCIGLFEVGKLIENKKRGRPEQPCPVCNDWQNIDSLLLNAPAAQPVATTVLFAEFVEVRRELVAVRQQLTNQDERVMGRFDKLDAGQRELLSKADASYMGLMQALTDEAKEGPRLFSLVPVSRSKFNPREWKSAKFRLTLWCEHSRLPIPELNPANTKKGVYEIELTREFFKKAAPYLKVLLGTLSLVLPVASSGLKLRIDETAYEAIENQLDFGKEVIEVSLDGSEKIVDWLGKGDETLDMSHGEGVRGHGAILRELHALLKAKDPGFGGLVRVRNKRQEFLWVHPQFEKEY